MACSFCFLRLRDASCYCSLFLLFTCGLPVLLCVAWCCNRVWPSLPAAR